MLDGLALAGRSPFTDSASDEEDELLNAGSLEVTEMANVHGGR